MPLREALITLPIHKRSREAYYADHAVALEAEKRRIEELRRRAFSELDREEQLAHERTWWWPPWEYNDVIGYVVIGLDHHGEMIGDVFLKRKHFRRDDPSMAVYPRTTKLRPQAIMSFLETQSVAVADRTNEAYVAAFETVVRKVRSMVRRRVRTSEIALPPWPISCLDFERAIAGVRGRTDS